MTLRNRFNNWKMGITKYNAKGCENVGMMLTDDGKGRLFIQYDWSKPFTIKTKKMNISNLKTKARIIYHTKA
jgi:hypothetical protein